MNNCKHFNTIDRILLVILLASLTVFPLIKINNALFIGFEEFIIPLLILRLLFSKAYFYNKYIVLIGIFSFYIFLTIAINGRLTSLRDYFEIYKLFKYVAVVYFCIYVFKKGFSSLHLIVNVILVIVVLLNFAHYFDIFGFNQIIEPYYAVNAMQLEFFGLDSLGNPAVRRMLGTMGNPNNNALLFLFFFAYYLSRKKERLIGINKIFLYISFFCILLTQSRTGFLSVIVIYIFWAVITKHSIKYIGVDILIFAASFIFAIMFDALALNYFSNTIDTIALDGTEGLYKNRSIMGRMEVWEHLMGMIKHKLVFGHGPNKDYFYENGLYAESEYVLYLWRYGILGIILYFGWVLFPLFKNFNILKVNSFFGLSVLIILVNAIGNCPLTNPRILLLFAIVTAYWYYIIDMNKQKM